MLERFRIVQNLGIFLDIGRIGCQLFVSLSNLLQLVGSDGEQRFERGHVAPTLIDLDGSIGLYFGLLGDGGA